MCFRSGGTVVKCVVRSHPDKPQALSVVVFPASLHEHLRLPLDSSSVGRPVDPHGPSNEKSATDPFLAYLQQLGNDHEARIASSLSHRPIPDGSEFRSTLDEPRSQ